MKLQGESVLSERQRAGESKISKELRDWYVKEEEARRKAALASLALQPPPPQHFVDSEQVSIKTKDSTWRRAQVASRGLFPDTYNVLVGPSHSIQSIELGVPSSRLQKAGMPKHTPVKGETPLCQKQGCMMLRLKAESGKEFQLRAVMGLRIAVLMKAACARLHEPWARCQTRIILSHGGRMLSPSWRTYEAGLENEAVVNLKMAPETATPVRSVSA